MLLNAVIIFKTNFENSPVPHTNHHVLTKSLNPYKMSNNEDNDFIYLPISAICVAPTILITIMSQSYFTTIFSHIIEGASACM
jgi:hypothetical protein